MALRTRASRLLFFAGILLATVVVGWVDGVVYPALAFTLFYIPPVVAAGWWLGRSGGIAVAVFGTAVWLYGAMLSVPELSFVTGWNTVTRLVLLGALGDLTAVVRRERTRLLELARTDALTRLPNARGFLEHLGREVARCRRNGEPICVAFADLDNFKRLNDLYGHAAGDVVLRRIGGILQEALRAGDLPARIGGDEFAILFDEAEPGQAEKIGRRLVERIRTIGADYPDVGLGVSFGIVWLAHPVDAEAVMGLADSAMYAAKSAGKGQVNVTRIAGDPPRPTPWPRKPPAQEPARDRR